MKDETVNGILEVGTELIFKNGYNGVGLTKILEKANIPKGSFYYYFKSKEDFGLKVIDFYTNQSVDFLKAFLENKERDPRTRIFDVFNAIRAIYQEQGYLQGCLLGNSSLELGAQKDVFAEKVSSGFDQMQALFTKVIQEGQETANIKEDYTPEEYAALIINNWEGALVRTKSTRSDKPMELFARLMDSLL